MPANPGYDLQVYIFIYFKNGKSPERNFMEETVIQQESQNSFVQTDEPVYADNSMFDTNENPLQAANQVNQEGESSKQDPSNELLLGKFKSVEDLSKAYQELQRYQGQCSDELGHLRKELTNVNEMKQFMDQFNTIHGTLVGCINRDKEKYNKPEYFQDPTFREIYKEALSVLGENLDTDRFVSLLENYVSARIFANDRKKAAQNETQKVLDSMTYEKNPKSSLTPPKKRFDEMSEKEIDEMLEKLI